MKALGLCIAFLISATTYSLAQSFSFETPAGIPASGDTITVTGTAFDFMLMGRIAVKNNASVTKAVLLERTILYAVPGTDNAFAFGVNMFPPSVSITPVSFDINPGVTDSSFEAFYFINGNVGTSYIQYTFFDELNPADSAWIIFKFVVEQPIGIPDLQEESKIYVYPNPVSNKIFVHTNGIQVSDVIIFNNMGKEVMRIKNYSPAEFIDTGFLNKGVYFILIEKNGQAIKFFKI